MKTWDEKDPLKAASDFVDMGRPYSQKDDDAMLDAAFKDSNMWGAKGPRFQWMEDYAREQKEFCKWHHRHTLEIKRLLTEKRKRDLPNAKPFEFKS